MEPLIFIVDDDPFFSRIVSGLLKKNDMKNIEIFNSGEACIEKLSKNPAIVFLDYEMGGLNGIDVLMHIRKQMPNTLVAMVSGQDKLEIAVKAMKIGAFDYVIKDNLFSSRFEKTINDIKSISSSC